MLKSAKELVERIIPTIPKDAYIIEVASNDGYLLKNCTYRQLTEAIKSVYTGKKFLSEDITELVINGFLDPSKADEDNYSQLSEREKEIFLLFLIALDPVFYPLTTLIPYELTQCFGQDNFYPSPYK